MIDEPVARMQLIALPPVGRQLGGRPSRHHPSNTHPFDSWTNRQLITMGLCGVESESAERRCRWQEVLRDALHIARLLTGSQAV